jgi:hypothetical protein
MIRLAKFLALAGLTLGGAFLTTAAQASAANFTVDFAIYDADSTYNMIRQTSPLPTGVSGLINPASAISPGGYDPASGSVATFTGPLPTSGHPAQASLVYSKDTDSTDACTFTVTVSYVGGPTPYELQFSASPSRCTVPGSVYSTNGQFTSTTYLLDWKA